MKPRVGLVLVDDGLYTHRWAAPVLRDPRLHIVFASCISPFDAVGYNPGPRPIRSRLRYYGLAETVKFAVKYLLERRHVASSISPPNGDVNDPSFCRAMRGFKPDLLLCAFSQKAGPDFLAVPRIGGLNVHFSMLPQHRGREPTFHAMLTGKGAGVSVHWMTPGLDEGAVVAQKGLDLSGIDTLHGAILAGCAAAGELVPDALSKARRIDASRVELPKMNGWPSARDVRAFRAKGFRFI